MAGQTIYNLGTGGSVLNAQSGSTSGSDTGDPKFLDRTTRNYVYLPGSTGNYLSAPDETALDITGDLDIRVYVAMDDWTPASAMMLLSKSNTASSNSWRAYLNTDGTIVFDWSADGTNFLNSVSSATGLTDGSAKWLRITLDVNNGAGGNTTTFYTSDDGSSWSTLGSAAVRAGTTSIYAGTASIEVGTFNGGLSNPAAMSVYRAQVYNGIGGTKVLDIDTSVVTAGTAASFTATTGQTVTINRASAGRKSVAVVSPVWLFGTDDLMIVANNTLVDFNATDSFTVVWIGRQWNTPTSYGKYIWKGDDPGYYLDSNATNTKFRTVLQDTSTGILNDPWTTGFTAGQLVVAGFVVNRSNNTHTAYQNGVAETPDSISGVGSLVNSNDLTINKAGSYQDFEFLGAAVFRRALTATEMSAITTYYQARLS